MDITPELVADLDGRLSADLRRNGRLGKTKRYLEGDHDLPYMPRKAKREYRLLATKSITNWLPLVPDTFAKSLFVDGYRPSRASDNSAAWKLWQENGLDARQMIAHRGALDYGTSYVLVLPAKKGEELSASIRPLDPLRSAAWYADDDDEFPEVALRRKGKTIGGDAIVEVFDSESVYTFTQPKEGGDWRESAREAHGLGVVPFVRFRESLSGECVGVVRPIIPIQDRVNDVVFSTMIALQYASFRQRWATGLAIPEDDDGNPVEPFDAAVDRLWVADSPDARFGDFGQTELSGHHATYDSAVSSMAAISQISPSLLRGDLVNVGAEAMDSLKESTDRKLDEYEVNFGESWESALRLAALAAGDAAGAVDTSAEVRWRDSETRAFAATVDGLGKAAQMLSIPVEELWGKVPGVTDAEVLRWKAAKKSDPLDELTRELARQTANTTATAPAAPAVT